MITLDLYVYAIDSQSFWYDEAVSTHLSEMVRDHSWSAKLAKVTEYIMRHV